MAKTDPSEARAENPEASTVNVPKLSKDLKVTQRAIRDGKQAWNIASGLRKANEERNNTDSIIWAKYSGAQPFDPIALANEGQSERYNFPTGFLSSIVDRITPVPIQIIDSARHLTSANLKTSEINPEAAQKSEKLRTAVTKAIRRWPQWKTFVTELCQELVLIGRAFVIFKDPYCPWPKFFRCDQAFLPEGTGQHSTNVQFISADEDIMVHELVNLIKNKEAAKYAGWEIQNCVEALDKALPRDPTSDSNPRGFEDAIREGNPGMSYEGALVIEASHIWAVEPSDVVGEECKVTHYIVSRKENHDVLFVKEDRYDKIENAVTLFTLEPGNGKFYGSKGIGRKLINMHLAIERARNRMFDQLEMAGLMILKTDASRAPYVQFKVRHPFVLVTSDAEFQEQAIQANVTAFLDADAKMTDLAQQAVGQYLPNNLTNDQGEREKTAREVSVDYQREAEAKVAFLARFWGQFADLVSAFQRKVLDPETTDKLCKKIQQELLDDGVTREDMKEFAEAPSAEVIQDMTQVQNQAIQQVQAKYLGNPSINQHKLMIKDITSMASAAVADELVLEEDGLQTNVIEGVRQQMIETEAMLSGAPGIPVSPRDPHEVHLKVLIPDLQKGLEGLAQNPTMEALQGFSHGIIHGEGHVQVMLDQKVPPADVKPYEDAFKAIGEALKQIAMGVIEDHAMQPDPQTGEVPPPPGEAPKPEETQKENISINYKDAPESIKRQMEAAAGFEPASGEEIDHEKTREAILKHPELAATEQPQGLPPGVEMEPEEELV